jgi:hypothetical protein
MASQQKLGLWTKWRYWPDFGHRPNPGVAEGNLNLMGTTRPAIVSPSLNRQRTNARIT